MEETEYDHDKVKRGDHIEWWNEAMQAKRTGEVKKLVDGTIRGRLHSSANTSFTIFDPCEKHKIKILPGPPPRVKHRVTRIS